MQGLETAIAARDWDGARESAIDDAMECIFGGGHGYAAADTLSGSDADTCRDCAAEALNEYSRRIDGYDATAEQIEDCAAEAAEIAQARIDEL